MSWYLKSAYWLSRSALANLLIIFLNKSKFYRKCIFIQNYICENQINGQLLTMIKRQNKYFINIHILEYIIAIFYKYYMIRNCIPKVKYINSIIIKLKFFFHRKSKTYHSNKCIFFTNMFYWKKNLNYFFKIIIILHTYI